MHGSLRFSITSFLKKSGVFLFLSACFLSASAQSQKTSLAPQATVYLRSSSSPMNSMTPTHESGSSVPSKYKLNAYPKPYSEALKLQWWPDDTVFVKNITVLSMTGIKTFQKAFSAGQAETSISFMNLPNGSYIVSALYSDGKREAIQVIKR